MKTTLYIPPPQLVAEDDVWASRSLGRLLGDLHRLLRRQAPGAAYFLNLHTPGSLGTLGDLRMGGLYIFIV
jgi:hypothetical protein